MEQLELLVLPSDLELTALQQKEPDDDRPAQPIGPPYTRLKLILSFFDKAEPSDPLDAEANEAAQEQAAF